MRDIFFQEEGLRELLDNLKHEKVNIENILGEYQHRIMSHMDKLGDFEEKIKLIREHLLRVEESIQNLTVKLESVTQVYSEVEEKNLRIVHNLTDPVNIFEGTETGPAPMVGVPINLQYNVEHFNNNYVVNQNYDFDDWLVEWLFHRLG